MNVVIVIHSQSGHTVMMARALAELLRKAGHEVAIELLRVRGKVHPGARGFSLRNTPEVEPYDMLLVGGPVWAFSASPVIMRFLSEVKSLKNKKAIPFVTMGFPFKALGGVQALRKMSDSLELSGAEVLPGEAVFYSFGKNQARIDAAAQRICDRITAAPTP
jgi:NAD(P)H dehydrogenase (quinone)